MVTPCPATATGRVGGAPADPATTARLLHEAGLARHADALASLGRESLALRLTPADDEPPAGASKLGGVPDLPEGSDWPRFRGVPQTFVGQLDLAELRAGGAAAGDLPAEGLLSFFYDAEQTAWGYDPEDRGAATVMLVPPGTPLTRLTPPDDLPRENRLAVSTIRPEPEHTAPPAGSGEVAALGLDEDELRTFDEVTAPAGPAHRLLGHPDAVHGDMQLECQLVAHGLACGDRSVFDDPRADELRPGAGDWRLLLQVDSDDALGTMWGDAGRIYYWLHADALAAGRWEDAWVVLQSR